MVLKFYIIELTYYFFVIMKKNKANPRKDALPDGREHG